MCRKFIWLFGLLYLGALALLLIGTFGLFGSERGPLAGVFLVPIGLPWNLLIDRLPEPLWPWLAAAAPAVNVALFWILCWYFKARQN
jgi:hypothetical protein